MKHCMYCGSTFDWEGYKEDYCSVLCYEALQEEIENARQYFLDQNKE